MFESNPYSNNKSAPRSTRLLLAQLLDSFIEYTSELTYFSINAFQASSLKRVQTSTLTRFENYSLPHLCAFQYSLDREFEEFIHRMKKLCKRTQTTFLDIRAARIHYPQSNMNNIPSTYRSLNVLKCNIERLRDLKEIHQDIGYDLLLPNDQLFLSLDLLVTNFQMILCELDNRVRFKDAIVLQTLVKDIFLQFRVILTWLYPVIQMAAYRINDPYKNPHKTTNKISRSEQLYKKPDFSINPLPTTKITQDRSQSALHRDEQKQSNEVSSSIIIDQFTNEQNLNCIANSYSSIVSLSERPSVLNENKEPNKEDKMTKIQQELPVDSVR